VSWLNRVLFACKLPEAKAPWIIITMTRHVHMDNIMTSVQAEITALDSWIPQTAVYVRTLFIFNYR
jgi:hypothetical protein